MCGIWALITAAKFDSLKLQSFQTIKPRGPDHTILHISKTSIIGFHRLSIVDLSSKGEQPFCLTEFPHKYTLICNGEIYNHQDLRQKYQLNIDSQSDCSVILPLFLKFGCDIELLNKTLLGEYAFFIVKEDVNSHNIQYWLSTDPLSVRPAFYYASETEFGVSSLLSGLSNLSNNVQRLDQGTFIHGQYSAANNENTIREIKKYTAEQQLKYFQENLFLYEKIVSTLTEAIEKRLMADRPIGCLLSGGLDSSLVASIAAQLLRKKGLRLRTFSIGMNEGTDLIYAREVAKHIDSDHTEFIYEPSEGLQALDEVIRVTETFDITTIRASVGQFLLAKKISSTTDIIVVLNGDGADECQMGYLYFYLAPNAEEAKADRDRLVQQIHLYDGLRVDRNISHFGLEARVPFLDKNFVNLFYQITPSLLIPTKSRMEKYLIRRAFEVLKPNVLPQSVLWRKKEAFSDGVSSKEKSWYQMVREYVATHLLPKLTKELRKQLADEKQAQTDKVSFSGLQPVCLESQYYRMVHDRNFCKNHQVFKHYWLPQWVNSTEPSARTLKVYHSSEQ